MKNYYNFTVNRDNGSHTEVSFETDASMFNNSVYSVVSEFEKFLKGCGFNFKSLQIQYEEVKFGQQNMNDSTTSYAFDPYKVSEMKIEELKPLTTADLSAFTLTTNQIKALTPEDIGIYKI